VSERNAVPPPVTAVLDASSRWLPTRLGEVEDRLRETIAPWASSPVGADAAATLAAGGKRLRPMLVLLCAGEGGGDAAVRAASAIELVHMATLVHDDVLDQAPLRRGLPTVAATSGRLRAQATGDLLLSRAFALLAEAGDARAVELLADASVALARGELAQRQDAFDLGIDEERYLQRCRLKTATLFECACLLGFDDGRLRRFGAEVGLAFQLLDDVLDVTGPPERTGKARGTDLLDGTITLPLILALKRDPGIGAVDLAALDAGSAEALCDRIARTGALEEVRSRALAMVAAAKEALADGGLEPEQRQLLALVADGVVQRYS
jgi:geranylgeranyl pyrophosphate synthase